ncbi:type VI secretion system-associated FHA domain protein TagH [Colwellia echini]|uniref:Type VI secretion system-associated FHA domain protein TagH n=1 Tax=Colwellia echini TaxID=1982103 RepID=A0ABY3MWF9_9GAMM|nr:type VI secretion system-associated FHA domain protein TagH [Colwellia echini]TYK65439.1 type VI secretion system-associated FHA domain protein TagH [Colwellia echini]
MPIEITIINSPSNANVGQTSHTFPAEGGTLGRGNNNFWVLDDPNKYMSSVHAKITSVANQYYITDLSTNGTFINGASEPLGNGNQIVINDGDQFTISDYEFIANIANAMSGTGQFSTPNGANVGSDPFADFDDLHSPAFEQDDFMSSNASGNDPFASGVKQNSSADSSISSYDAEQIDPLELLDNAKATNDPFAQPVKGLESFSQDSLSKDSISQRNNIPDSFTASTSTSIESNSAATDSISWPSVNHDTSLIPDDWDDDDLMSDFMPPVAPPMPVNPAPMAKSAVQNYDVAGQQTTNQSVEAPISIANQAASSAVEQKVKQRTEAEYVQLELQNQQLKLEVEQLKLQLSQAEIATNRQAATQQPTSNTTSKETQSVVNAMGLEKWNLSDAKVAQINNTVGLLMRETMQGMMRVLKFRKKIKEEFRINVTTIQSIENNPLKFSANIDDAMENMFIKENNAYKQPIDAVKEGFQGIAEHQVAVIAGMQAAFRGMIDRFDPNNLENRFEKYKTSSLLSIGQKGKRWSAYKEYHQGLTENIDDSFQHLFGYDFVQAYEEQMQHLISARLSVTDDEKK